MVAHDWRTLVEPDKARGTIIPEAANMAAARTGFSTWSEAYDVHGSTAQGLEVTKHGLDGRIDTFSRSEATRREVAAIAHDSLIARYVNWHQVSRESITYHLDSEPDD